MKKIALISSLLCAFFLFTANVTQAQFDIQNTTGCDMVVKIAYGTSCTTVTGTATFTIAAGTSVPVTLPFGTGIIQAKGTDVSFTCPIWNIGRPSCGFSISQTVNCGLLCGIYTAEFLSGDLVIHP